MGLFEKLFPKKREKIDNGWTQFKTLTAYQPVFRTYRGAIYENELIRAAIDTRAKHISKLSVSLVGAAKPVLQTKLKQAPNPYQTWSQFLYRWSTILDVNNTAFIIPLFDEFGRVDGIYPLLPSRCSLVEYKGVPYVRYEFRNGQHAAIELDKVGVTTKFQYHDDVFGDRNDALIPTMRLIDIQNQGIEEGVKSSATFRFMAKLNNFSKSDDLVTERKNFSAKNLTADAEGGGLLLFPNYYTDIKQIDAHPFVIDDKQMKAIKDNVFSYFGVSEKVLQAAATDEELDAYWNTSIEPFAIQLAQVLTKMLFTSREQASGSRVDVSASRLQYMSVSHKISMARELADRGCMTIDEIRELFNYAPLPDGAGDMVPIRGEYYDVQEDSDDNE